MATSRLEEMDREERVEFCRQVMERLSDLLEERADPEFCERVARVLGDCQPYRVYRDTLARTIELAGECGELGPGEAQLDEEAFRARVERVRARLKR